MSTINDRLLKFAGLEFKTQQIKFGTLSVPFSGYYLNGQFIRKTKPDLVNDMSYQQKYLYPKLIELWGERISITLRHFEDASLKYPNEKQWHVTIGKWELSENGFVLRYGGFGDTPAIAFANAINKLIESEDK